jgi:hypothetical protein
LATPIDYGFVNKLRQLAEEYGEKAGVKILLEIKNGEAFKGFKKSYGLFSGVNNYIGLIENKNDKNSKEKLGYYGELLVLHATDLRLGTCWVGGTFDRSLCPFELASNESIACVITVGNVPNDKTLKEKLIHSATHRHSKSLDEMFVSDSTVPKWFSRGLSVVQKAPSAMNRQPVMFSFKNGAVSAFVKDPSEESLDLGIAKLHFELGAGAGVWDWGNGAEFHYPVNRR